MRFYSAICIGAFCTFVVAQSGVCQDAEQIKQRILASLSKIENYPVGIVKGKAIYRGDNPELAYLQYRGNKMWMEIDDIATKEADVKRLLTAVYEVKGTSNFPRTLEFDGKRLFTFNPYNLSLDIQSVKSIPSNFERCALWPKYWLHMGGNPHELFRDVVQDTIYNAETKVEQISPGRWKLSQTNIGSLLPEGNGKVAIRDRYIIVDEKCDYLVTEYFGSGNQGKLSGSMVWEKQDGNWYAKQGNQKGGARPYAEWNIDEISFDASKCRTKFDDLESIVPFATCITRMDEKSRPLSKEYKGGVDGETEHKLRELAWSKRKKDGL